MGSGNLVVRIENARIEIYEKIRTDRNYNYDFVYLKAFDKRFF